MLGFSQITVLPSKTAILPVNPTFLPRVCRSIYLKLFHFVNYRFLKHSLSTCFRILYNPRVIYVSSWCFGIQSEDEREMCARTVYCTNIDKKVRTVFPFYTYFWMSYQYHLRINPFALYILIWDCDRKFFVVWDIRIILGIIKSYQQL